MAFGIIQEVERLRRMTCVRAKEHEPSMANGIGVGTLENQKE